MGNRPASSVPGASGVSQPGLNGVAPGLAAHTAGTEMTPPGGGRENLTVFFSIGIAIDVLLVTLFLVWAVRQWRKSGK